jgi:hypothetical protein
MALWPKGPERGRRVDPHTTKCTVYIGASSLDDWSAQVFPYNIFAYCSICRVDCKFARNKKKIYSSLGMYEKSDFPPPPGALNSSPRSPVQHVSSLFLREHFKFLHPSLPVNSFSDFPRFSVLTDHRSYELLANNMLVFPTVWYFVLCKST